MDKIILLMIEQPRGTEQIILGIAGNEKEAEEMAKNTKKIHNGPLLICGYTLPRGILLQYSNFLTPKVYALR